VKKRCYAREEKIAVAPDAMGKGEGREDGVILHLGINEERGYFRQLTQPSS
jgi:hypothetical protein